MPVEPKTPPSDEEELSKDPEAPEAEEARNLSEDTEADEIAFVDETLTLGDFQRNTKS